MKCYRLELPVFKQGRDLCFYLEDACGDAERAFRMQADAYTRAAALCTRMAEAAAGVASDPDALAILANSHSIFVGGNPNLIASLLEDKTLTNDDAFDSDNDDDVPPSVRPETDEIAYDPTDIATDEEAFSEDDDL